MGICVLHFMEKVLTGKFREIRETSRRENFPRRISGNPGNFPSGKFHMVFYNIIYYNFRYKCSLNVCCEHIMCIKRKKFLPWEITCVFTKREETFSGESFPEISGENVTTVSHGKVFPIKVSHESVTTQTLQKVDFSAAIHYTGIVC